METKRCVKCGRELPLSEFHKSKKGSSEYHSYCKECQRAYQRNIYYQKIAAKSETGEGMDIDRLRLALARFTSTELLTELKARGYEWEKMYEPRREVLFENV